ncbi:MAG TPA: hypothetical protein VE954_34485 [Oligoflexus sp.]|uniref:hypothetical protein n=1 Tax=Oligoflexus sp. TaxID=1971216 RepID=UPI002D6A2DBE|nr:hypothetical protein [Oligoflexus sp.]HYX38238.1 hypothetical protein [Oligoflexus sp.]
MNRRMALAEEIQTWLKGGKRRSLSLLQRATGIHRNTLSAAAEGSVQVSGYNVLRILSVVSSPERIKEFVHEFMPELKSIFEKMAESTFVAADDLSELECKILTDVVFEDSAANSFASGSTTAGAVARLIKKNCLEQQNGILKAVSGLLIGNNSIVSALSKFAVKKLNLVRPDNYGTIWFANCDDETRQMIMDLIREIELRTAEISKRYKPGPHRVAMVSFVTDLGDLVL